MPYFPKTYPEQNWWAGKTFVFEGKRIINKAETTRLTENMSRIVYLNLERAIRTLLLLPSVQSGTDCEDQQLKIELPKGYPCGHDHNDPIDAINKAKEFFYNHFRETRYNEYTHWVYSDEEISTIIDRSEETVIRLLEEDSFTDAERTLIDDAYNSDNEEFISNNFDSYWEMEEYDLLSRFDGYGAFRGL